MGNIVQTQIFGEHRKPSWQQLLPECPHTLPSQELGTVLCDPQADGKQHQTLMMPRLKSAGAMAWLHIFQSELCWMLTLSEVLICVVICPAERPESSSLGLLCFSGSGDGGEQISLFSSAHLDQALGFVHSLPVMWLFLAVNYQHHQAQVA